MLSVLELGQYLEARREGYSPAVALYSVRPPVVQALEHYQVDGWFAEFEFRGETFRAEMVPDADCGCGELVEAWRNRDDSMAWLTEDEYDRMDHQSAHVTAEADGRDAWLGGVCTGVRGTPTGRRLDERWVAETWTELAGEILAERAEDERITRVAEERRQEEERARLWV